ncbi:hypothetical protein GCM10009560_50920 [Nonomuraea longicatena]|uniref:Uncharacterized protein n=1 Tax=Nonomuraea longicatena TaxID=83682 RepID=A0ABP4AS17_9ACTN
MAVTADEGHIFGVFWTAGVPCTGGVYLSGYLNPVGALVGIPPYERSSSAYAEAIEAGSGRV